MTEPITDIETVTGGTSQRSARRGQPDPAPPNAPPDRQTAGATDPTGASASPEQADEAASSAESNKTGVVRKLLQALLALVALAVGVMIMVALAQSKPEQPRAAQRVQGPLVSVEPITFTDVPVEVTGFGTVQPRHEIEVVPQVGGQVVEVHPALTAGGIIPAGQTILRIDPRDYELAVQTAEANVEQANATIQQARTALAVEQAEADVRIAEWRGERGDDAEVPDLVARGPQIREREAMLASARAQLASAEASLARARLDLERTTVTAPADVRVLEESIDLGQTAVARQPVATLYRRAVMRIVVPLDDGSMRWLELPEPRPDESPDEAYARGVPVRITGRYGGRQREWVGRALHTTGQVDTQSRLIEVVVEVRQPTEQSAPPLLPGMFVTAHFQGPVLERVARIPRHAIRDDGRVWVAENLEAAIAPIAWSEPWSTDATLNATLRHRAVEVVRLERDCALISDGLTEKELVVTSALDVVTDGMDIRLPTPRTRPPSGPSQQVAPDTPPTTPADLEPDASRD